MSSTVTAQLFLSRPARCYKIWSWHWCTLVRVPHPWRAFIESRYSHDPSCSLGRGKVPRGIRYLLVVSSPQAGRKVGAETWRHGSITTWGRSLVVRSPPVPSFVVLAQLGKYRDLTISSLGLKPSKFTDKGSPAVSIDVLRELAGNPLDVSRFACRFSRVFQEVFVGYWEPSTPAVGVLYPSDVGPYPIGSKVLWLCTMPRIWYSLVLKIDMCTHTDGLECKKVFSWQDIYYSHLFGAKDDLWSGALKSGNWWKVEVGVSFGWWNEYLPISIHLFIDLFIDFSCIFHLYILYILVVYFIYMFYLNILFVYFLFIFYVYFIYIFIFIFYLYFICIFYHSKIYSCITEF